MIVHPHGAFEKPRLPSTEREYAANHVACDAAGQVARVQGAAGDIRGLAELVATREGEGVRDGKGEGDGCMIETSISDELHSTHITTGYVTR